MIALIIICCLILAITCFFILSTSQQETYGNINTDEKILNTIRNMLKDIDALFAQHNITYWIDGGTLLGAVRHKNVIPWDDDADIAVLESDKHKLLAMEKELNTFGYGLVEFWGGFKIFPLNGNIIKYQNRNWKWGNDSKDIENSESFNYKFPFIDVFFAKKFGDKYHFSDEKVRRVWPNYYHKPENLFPLQKYQFSDFTLMGPKNPTPYLDQSYGKDWSYMGYRAYDHENQQILDKKKFQIGKNIS
jgi:phosphorylcholine metabolism protein LicD